MICDVLGDISAEELFNIFFGAGFQTGMSCMLNCTLSYFGLDAVG